MNPAENDPTIFKTLSPIWRTIFTFAKQPAIQRQADWLATPLTQRKQRNNTHLYTHLSGSIVELCELQARECAILLAAAVCMRHWGTLPLMLMC